MMTYPELKEAVLSACEARSWTDEGADLLAEVSAFFTEYEVDES